ncbi:MAG: LuxR C-terminal-related transcriptional regulator [Ktedonobacterales bacterium]
MEREHDNLHAALRWLLDQYDPAERERALQLAGALGSFWFERGYHAEGWRWLEEALARAPQDAEGTGADQAAPTGATGSAPRIGALLAAGELLAWQDEFARAQARNGEALMLARQSQDPACVVQALTNLGACAVLDGRPADAFPLLEEALDLARGRGAPFPVGLAQYLVGAAAQERGDAVAAPAHFAEALDRLEAAGDARLADAARFALGAVAAQQGDMRGAAAHVRVGLVASVRLRDRWLLSQATHVMLTMLGAQEDHGGRGPLRDSATRARLLGAADALRQAIGAGRIMWEPRPATDWAEADLRHPLPDEEWAAAYREGQWMPLGEIATLLLTLLDEFALTQVSAPPRPAPAIASTPEGARGTSVSVEHLLTERERDVLRLVAQGLSSKEIARRLSIAPSTANYHLSSVFNKLGVDKRAQAVAVAAQRGLL